jgi:hypothetical protein
MKTILAAVVAAEIALVAAPAEKKLAIVAAAFSQSEDGPSTARDDQFVPGETLFFRCQVEGYKKSDKDEIHLAYQVQAADARDIPLLASENGMVQSTLSPEDKNWLPKIRYTVIVPALADAGEYHVLVKVKDELAGTSAEARVTFLVLGRNVAPSDTLVVRNFRFFHGENEDQPLKLPVYRPGDTLWARFDMTGFKIGEKNLFDIEYGLVVLRADGTTAYSQPQAATAKEAPFYPQRYQPGELSLNMPNDIAKGDYTIVLTVHDNLGKQISETREKFSIE